MEDKITVREEVKEPIEQNVKNGSQSGVVGLAILAIIGNLLEMQFWTILQNYRLRNSRNRA